MPAHLFSMLSGKSEASVMPSLLNSFSIDAFLSDGTMQRPVITGLSLGSGLMNSSNEKIRIFTTNIIWEKDILPRLSGLPIEISSSVDK